MHSDTWIVLALGAIAVIGIVMTIHGVRKDRR